MRGLLLLGLFLWNAVIVQAAFHSLPLVPHHVQQRRRRRLLQLSGELNNNNNNNNNNNTTTATPQRRSRLSSDRNLRVQQVGALYQGYGTHYVDLWCGSKTPQRQTVIVDTGSAVTAFPCSGCRNLCGKDYHIDQVFDETLSETFEKLPCDSCMRGRCTVLNGNSDDCKIGMSYQEGSSWTAFEAKDYCYIGGPHSRPLPISGVEGATYEDPKEDIDKDGISTADVDPSLAANHAFRLVFGCQTKLTGLFKTQLADGIMGMDNAHESFWHQMSAAGRIDEDIFTLCFARQPTADRGGTEAGAMTLGGVDPRLHTSPIVYASVGVSNAFYGVHVRNVYLRAGGGGDSAISSDPSLQVKRIDISEADLNRGTTIVDSGTTDTYFTRNIAKAFQTAWKELTGKSYNNNPVDLNQEQLDALPTILFQLQGLTELNEKVAKEHSDPVVGLVGAIDPEHPYDILLAMPPSHYMEYDNDLKKYVPRFYTDEGRGSVLGANVMMGHDIIFDQVNGRLGIAESHCDYATLVSDMGFEWNPHETYSKLDHMDISEAKAEEIQAAQNDNEDEDEDKALMETSGGTAGETTGGGFCSSTGCQGGIAGAALVAVLAGVLIVKRRKRSAVGPGIPVPYSTDLELRGPRGSDEGEFGTYKDDDDGEEEGFQDE